MSSTEAPGLNSSTQVPAVAVEGLTGIASFTTTVPALNTRTEAPA